MFATRTGPGFGTELRIKLSALLRNLCGALAAGAILLGGNASAADLKLTFSMPTTPAAYLLPFFVAKDLGWYEKAGLDVNEVVITGDANAIRAIITGDADITFIGPSMTMNAIATGAQVKIVGSVQPGLDYMIVARNGAGTTLKELADKKWAIASVGGMTQTLPRMLIKKHGGNADATQYLTVGGLAQRYQALAAGTVDASVLDVQLALRAEQEGRGKVITSIKDELPKMAYAYFPVKSTSLTDPQKRKALEIFVRESIRGARYIVENPKAAAEILVKRMKAGDVNTMTAVLTKESGLGIWGINGGLDRDILEYTYTTYRESGDIKADVTIDKIVDTSLVDAALKELGKK